MEGFAWEWVIVFDEKGLKLGRRADYAAVQVNLNKAFSCPNCRNQLELFKPLPPTRMLVPAIPKPHLTHSMSINYEKRGRD
ncbi:hypothetical protein CEXT_143701 [Caerostris extrusa]|uniref:Uncharacterized protein n=1 Tax=Caerostris extrusa TaxID=172846 RepID=A0AAV4PIV3_CAEEX|nr:hypothetical protein CEXT_143701 [Caerostris extrusa]